MRLRTFLIGVACGLLFAPRSGRETWAWLRNRLAATIDAALSIGTGA